MVAGEGIVHSERTRDALRETGYRLHGLQLWHALPADEEDRAPSFHHYASDEIPEVTLDGGVTARVMMGTAFGATSPVRTFAETLYYEVRLPTGGSITLPDAPERAVYVADGDVKIAGDACDPHTFVVLNNGPTRIEARSDARIAVIGGEPLGERYIRWNFVSSSRDKIREAETKWKDGRFPSVPGDEHDFIPLPQL